METKKKEEIKKDLKKFSEGKEYCAKIGKAWKRGYLLYGPPGTEINSLLAETNMASADVAENLMPKSDEEDADSCLKNLIEALKVAKGEARKNAEEEALLKAEEAKKKAREEAKAEKEEDKHAKQNVKDDGTSDIGVKQNGFVNKAGGGGEYLILNANGEMGN